MRLAFALALLFPVQAGAAAPGSAPPTDLVLIFDTSGSMNETVPGGRKLDLGKSAMWRFVELLPKDTSVGLVAFRAGCDVRTVSPIKKASSEARARLRSDISGLRAEGSTPIGYALAAATKLLAGSPRKKTVVILTDGEETCDQAAFDRAADEAWKAGIKVYGIGFAMGQAPSRNFRRLGIYKDARDDKQLASVFQDIRKSLEKGGARYDEGKAAAGDAPAVSWVGRRGRFPAAGSARAGRLYATLALKSSYEPRFGPADRFSVLEHGYHVLFDPEQFTADKVEVLRVRLEEKLNFSYGGAEGFVLAGDVTIE
jgi:Ca-activated chloride channel family protein